jgi:hypothetical protein
MEKLGFCLTTWQHAQESVLKTAQLLRLDLDAVSVGDESLPAVLSSFTDQLRAIKQALEDRDYVALGDVLLYEMTETTPRWLGAIEALRLAIQADHHC